MSIQIRTHSSLRLVAGLLLLACVAAPANAQLLYGTQALGEANHWTWSENAGFMTFRRVAGNCNNVVLRPGLYMEGSAWGENIGWINFGNRPLNNARYTNIVESTLGGPVLNYGVNVLVDSLQTNICPLSGWAWGENVGWINFDAANTTTPPNPARFDFNAKRLRGYAWGENIGWINFDSIDVRVEYFCRADTDQNGIVDVPDIFGFLDAWFSEDARADFACNGVNVQAIFLFLESWFAGC